MLPIMKQKPFAPALLDIYDTKKTAHLHRNHNTDTKESAFFCKNPSFAICLYVLYTEYTSRLRGVYTEILQ